MTESDVARRRFMKLAGSAIGAAGLRTLAAV